MPPHSVRDPMIETLHHSTSMSLDGEDENDYGDNDDHDDDDDEHIHPQNNDDTLTNHFSDSSMDSDTIREQRRRCYEVCQTDEELFAQHNTNIQSIFDNRHHEIQFDQNEIQCSAGGGGGGDGDDDPSVGGGSSLGGYSNMSYNDNSTQGSVRTREELRLSLIARRRRLAQLENALDGEGSLDLSLKLNRSEKDGDNSLMSSVSLNESITDSLIARIMGKKKKSKKKKIQEAADAAAEKGKKSKDNKSSSKTKDRATKVDEGRGGGNKDKSGQKKNSKEKKKKSKHSKRHKDKEKSHKSKKSEKKHEDDKKSRRRSSRRQSSSSSSEEEDDSSSSDSETDNDEEYYTKRRSSQQSSAQQQQRRAGSNNILDKSRTKQMMTMGGRTIQKLKQMAPTSTSTSGGGISQQHPPTTTTSTDRQQQNHHGSSSNGVVYFACNEATGMCAFHPDVQLRKKSMFGGWNDVLKQCPKCMSESYSRAGGGGGVNHQSTTGRRQLSGGGARQSIDWQRSGGVNNKNTSSDAVRFRHTHPTTMSDDRMRQQTSSTDQRSGMMYRGQVHPHQSSSHRTPSDARQMPSSQLYPTSYRGGGDRGGDSSKYPGAGGAASKSNPRNAALPVSAPRQHQHSSSANQFYSSLHFQKTQEVVADKTSTSRRQSYPDVAYQDSSTNANHHLPQHYQHPTKPPQHKNPSNGRRAHFGADPSPSSRPTSSNVMSSKGPKRVSIGEIEDNPIPRQDEYDTSHHHAMYTYGDEGRRRDMIEDTNEEVAFHRISNLKPGYPAFIKRSTGQWTYAKVKHVNSDMMVFHVDANGSSKAYSVKHWTSHIRTLRVANHDGGW